MSQAMNVKDLQCFLGMVNYLNKYSPRLAEHGGSLRTHQEKCTSYKGPEHTEAFNAIQKEISSALILKYYDPKNDCTQMQAQKVLMQYFSKKATKYTLPVIVSSHN